MRKLSEIKGEDALDVLADVLDPIMEISADEKFVAMCRGNGKKSEIVKYLLKTHKCEVLEVMAILDGEDPQTYAPPIVKLPVMLLELFNDPDLISLFQSQDTVTSSGSATENTEETDKTRTALSNTSKRSAKKK